MSDMNVKSMISAREKASVLKHKLEQFISSLDDCAIFAFEGIDEKIIYSKWISRINNYINYEFFICNGKENCKTLSNICDRDLGGDLENVYIFVDRDYDDLNGFSNLDNVFVTDRYSVENYICDVEVIKKVLREEFPFHNNINLRQRLCEKFIFLFNEFLLLSKNVNKKLFLSSISGVSIAKGKPDKINQIVFMTYDNVQKLRDPPENNIEYSKPIIESDYSNELREFENFSGAFRYRGKYNLMFMEKWILLLSNKFTERSEADFEIYESKVSVNKKELTIGGYASKSSFPTGLSEFLEKVSQKMKHISYNCGGSHGENEVINDLAI